MSTSRQILESPLNQGADESISYTLTTTPWGSSPTNVSVKVYDITSGAYSDVSDTVLSGDPAVSGDVITLPSLASLTPGVRYRLEIKFTAGGNTLECYAEIYAER